MIHDTLCVFRRKFPAGFRQFTSSQVGHDAFSSWARHSRSMKQTPWPWAAVPSTALALALRRAWQNPVPLINLPMWLFQVLNSAIVDERDLLEKRRSNSRKQSAARNGIFKPILMIAILYKIILSSWWNPIKIRQSRQRDWRARISWMAVIFSTRPMCFGMRSNGIRMI